MTTTIQSIEKIANCDGYTFKVCVRCNGGHVDGVWDVFVVVTPEQLVTYKAFQKAALKSAALMFCDDRYQGRGGAESWECDVQWLLQSPSKKESAA